MRKARLAILILIVVVGGYFAWRTYRRSTESPFAFGPLRAGRSYKDVDAELTERDRTQRTCTPIAGNYQICRGPMDEPKGDALFVVNERGRIVIVDEHVTEVSEAARTATAALIAQWNEESQGSVVKRSGAPDATRWLSEDNKWSAAIVTQGGAHTLREVLLTHDHGLLTMHGPALSALLVLSREGLVEAKVLDATERRMPGALARAADQLAAPAAPLADAAAKLPTCGPQAALGIDAGMARRAALGPAASDIVTQAVARVYPDRRLELRDSVYLVDADNVPELIEVTDPVRVRNGAAFAFAINYAGRATSVAQRVETFDAPACRSPAEIVVAQLDRSRTRVTSVERFPVDDDAFASRVMELRANPKGSSVVAHTTSTYGTGDWYGEVDWIDDVSLDSLRVVDRVPATLAKMDARSRVAAVDLATRTADGVSRPSQDGRRVTAIVQARGGSSAQPIVLPSATDGRPSGWRMLTVL